jgi:hypothetical protein
MYGGVVEEVEVSIFGLNNFFQISRSNPRKNDFSFQNGMGNLASFSTV